MEIQTLMTVTVIIGAGDENNKDEENNPKA